MFVGFLFSEDFKKIVGKIKKKCGKAEVVGDAVAAEITEGSVDNFVSESVETDNAESPGVDDIQADYDTETTAEYYLSFKEHRKVLFLLSLGRYIRCHINIL